MNCRLILLLLFANFFVQGHCQDIVPFPNNCKQSGGYFFVPKTVSLTCNKGAFSELVPVFSSSLKKFTVLDVVQKQNKGKILLVKNPAITGKEAYRLKIESEGITIEAGYSTGCFYGLQSLLQLLHGALPGGQIACAEIIDQPRFEWRGFMLDESRHFFGMAEVEKILDMMALHKLNKFHWHLTDSPGWRIEIKQYPLLTGTGARGNFSDPEAGAYPEFSGGGSRKFPDFTFHPGKEGTYVFLTNVLKEVAVLFPSKFIHIGGDEVSYGNQQWTDFPEIQQLMKQKELKDLTDVEHYFLRRMADSIQKSGKTMIGWDEIVTAGLTNHPRIMWWRHDKPQMLDMAIKNGYEVILCPRIPLYFDFVQLYSHQKGRKWGGKYAPVESVYNFPSDQFTGGISIATPHYNSLTFYYSYFA